MQNQRRGAAGCRNNLRRRAVARHRRCRERRGVEASARPLSDRPWGEPAYTPKNIFEFTRLKEN